MPRPLLSTLRGRLFALLAVLGAVTALGVGGATYFSVRAEADALFDYQLRQTALSLRDQGRIARDDIVDQAGYLARGDKAGFEAKYGALGGEL